MILLLLLLLFIIISAIKRRLMPTCTILIQDSYLGYIAIEIFICMNIQKLIIEVNGVFIVII